MNGGEPIAHQVVAHEECVVARELAADQAVAELAQLVVRIQAGAVVVNLVQGPFGS